MASTLKFRTDSPYKHTQRTHHESDIWYQRYLHDIGAEKRKTKYDVIVPEEKKEISLGLFGLGRAGSIHFGNIIRNPRLRLRYMVDEDKSRFEHFAKMHNLRDVKFLLPKEADKLFQDKSLHAVVIATPTKFHEELVTKALKNNKAVLCEKPIALTLEATQSCFDLAKKTGTPLLCGFNRRFDPQFSYTRQRVLTGDIGCTEIIKTVARDSPLPPIAFIKQSGGIFHDCAVHDIDIICWVLGEYPTHVFALAEANIPEIKAAKDYDTILFNMKFASGVISSSDISRNAVYGYDQTLEVFGTKGMMRTPNEKILPTIYSGQQGDAHLPIQFSVSSRYRESFMAELDHFCDVIQGLEDQMVTGENCCKIIKIANALEESAKSREFVKVNY